MESFSNKEFERTHRQEDELYLEKNSSGNLSKIYDRFSPALFGVILKWVNDKEIAEELLKNVFITNSSANRYEKTKERFFTWLYRITQDTCINYLKN